MEFLAENNLWIFILIMLWVLPWKGYSLWSAARRKDKVWFILLLFLNTLAILDIIYLFGVAKVHKVDDKEEGIVFEKKKK